MILETKTRLVEPDITVVEVSGRLNLGNALQALESSIKLLIDQGSSKVVVDLTKLQGIDSSGVGMLLSCYAHMEQAGGGLRVAGAHTAVASVFQVVHLDRIVPLDKDLTASTEALR